MKNKSSVIVALFLLTSTVTACFFRGESDYEQQTKYAEDRILKDETLRKLDKLCKELPKPDDFGFLGKNAGNNTKFVGYKYKTSLSYETSKGILRRLFYAERLET